LWVSTFSVTKEEHQGTNIFLQSSISSFLERAVLGKPGNIHCVRQLSGRKC